MQESIRIGHVSHASLKNAFFLKSNILPTLGVIETATSTTPERKFTYKQILEATAVLSHHFVQHGIQRGEVVMIFARTLSSHTDTALGYWLTPALI